MLEKTYWFLLTLVFSESLGSINILNKLKEIKDVSYRPKGSVTKVECEVFIRSLEFLPPSRAEGRSRSATDFSLDILLREYWLDSRLAEIFDINSNVSEITLTTANEVTKLMWKPDLHMVNLKAGTGTRIGIVGDSLIKISEDGQVFWSSRQSLTLNCKMDFKFFPYDQHICKVNIESFAYNTDELTLGWKSKEPILLSDALFMHSFSLNNIWQSKAANISFFEMGWTEELQSYDRLVISFSLQRNRTVWVIKVYIPSVIIVLIGYLSFWIDTRASAARVSLCVTTTTTMTTLAVGISASFPNINYIMAIDIWLLTCTFFIYFGLFEYVLVNNLLMILDSSKKVNKSTRESKTAKDQTMVIQNEQVELRSLPKQVKQKIPTLALISDSSHGNRVTTSNVPKTNRTEIERKKTYQEPNKLIILLANYLDIICRFVYLIAFISFSVVYWTVFLNKNSYIVA